MTTSDVWLPRKTNSGTNPIVSNGTIQLEVLYVSPFYLAVLFYVRFVCLFIYLFFSPLVSVSISNSFLFPFLFTCKRDVA